MVRSSHIQMMYIFTRSFSRPSLDKTQNKTTTHALTLDTHALGRHEFRLSFSLSFLCVFVHNSFTLNSMGDVGPIRTIGDYSRPSHEGYQNTIEIPQGNDMVPLRSDTIRLVQNGCSFHGLRYKDPNQHLKGFLKLTDSLDLM